MSTNTIWFKLFANCLMVEGECRSLIYDTQRNRFYDLPDAGVDILKLAPDHTVEDIRNTLEYDPDTIDSFFDQLVKSEIGFYTHSPEQFPAIDLTWYSPYPITNAILEFAINSPYSMLEVVTQLSELACRAVQVRVVSELDIHALLLIVDTFQMTRIRHVELLIPMTSAIDHAQLRELMVREPRLNHILVYACAEEKLILHEAKSNKLIIEYTKDIRTDDREILTEGRFNTNIEIFSEAQVHNLGLNRKVCINRNGEIMNYLDHDIHYGSVTSIAISEIVHSDEFIRKWHISNDQIEGCATCHYRYACISNSDIKVVGEKYYKTNPCSLHMN